MTSHLATFGLLDQFRAHLELSPEEAAAIVDLALSTDRAEPDILRRLRSGEAIGTVLPGGME